MANKRRPGGGSKPRGVYPGKSATFTTRVQADTRRALDEAAGARGLSVSTMAEHLLRDGLKKPSGKPHNQAMIRAIELLAERVEDGTKKDWRDDPWTGQALRYAVETLLFHFAATPDGIAAVPPAIEEAVANWSKESAEHFRKAAGYGNTLAYNLILELEQSDPSTPVDEWSMPIFLDDNRRRLNVIRRDLKEKRNTK
jgi:hypothetical protein